MEPPPTGTRPMTGRIVTRYHRDPNRRYGRDRHAREAIAKTAPRTSAERATLGAVRREGSQGEGIAGAGGRAGRGEEAGDCRQPAPRLGPRPREPPQRPEIQEKKDERKADHHRLG